MHYRGFFPWTYRVKLRNTCIRMADVPAEFRAKYLSITSLYLYSYANSLGEAVLPVRKQQDKKMHGRMEVKLHTYF
jgi:hypothetical protein